jgi:hypothetical protein
LVESENLDGKFDHEKDFSLVKTRPQCSDSSLMLSMEKTLSEKILQNFFEEKSFAIKKFSKVEKKFLSSLIKCRVNENAPSVLVEEFSYDSQVPCKKLQVSPQLG